MTLVNSLIQNSSVKQRQTIRHVECFECDDMKVASFKNINLRIKSTPKKSVHLMFGFSINCFIVWCLKGEKIVKNVYRSSVKLKVNVQDIKCIY